MLRVLEGIVNFFNTHKKTLGKILDYSPLDSYRLTFSVRNKSDLKIIKENLLKKLKRKKNIVAKGKLSNNDQFRLLQCFWKSSAADESKCVCISIGVKRTLLAFNPGIQLYQTVCVLLMNCYWWTIIHNQYCLINQPILQLWDRP